MDKEGALEYRKNLLEQAHSSDKHYDDQIADAEIRADEFDVEVYRRSKQNTVRYNLKIARWNKEYWEARFIKLGIADTNDRGELVDPQTGLTAFETAERNRLVSVLKDFNFDSSLVEILDIGISLSSEVLRNPEIKKLAEDVVKFAIEVIPGMHEYHSGLSWLGRIPEFVEKFGLGHDAWQPHLLKVVKGFVANRQWEQIREILPYAPFVNQDMVRDLHREQFYGESERISEADLMQIFGLSKQELETLGEITVAELATRLKGREKLLADRMFKIPSVYFELRSVLQNHIPMQSVFSRADKEPYNRMRIWAQFTPDSLPIYRAKLIYYLGNAENNRDRTRLELTVAQNKEVPLRDERSYGNHFYLGTNTFQLEKMALTNKARNRYDEKIESEFEVDVGSEQISPEGLPKITLAPVQKLAEVALAPERDLSVVFDTIDGLCRKYELKQQEVEDLKLAIREFAKYTYSVTESSVGDCLVTPLDFAHFCHLKFRLEIDTGRYGENHPEWGGDTGYSPCTFLHEVNVVFGKIVIDWTVTQYRSHKNKPVPYVYEIGDELKRFGPLFSAHSGETPNDPYPGTELPEGYEVVYGI